MFAFINKFKTFILSKSNDPATAAVKIQKIYRGHLTRKKYEEKYKLSHLDKKNRAQSETYVVGNDPEIPAELDQYRESSGKVAVVGCSGLRAIEIACRTGNREHTPKIIIIDNSELVYKFWNLLKKFVESSPTRDVFLAKFDSFLQSPEVLATFRLLNDLNYIDKNAYINRDVKYLNQNITSFMTNLFDKYGYYYVCNIIKYTSVLMQDWKNTEVFNKLKNILSRLGFDKVYVYPSNILTCSKPDIDLLLNNIQVLSPVATIHTNKCDSHGKPENVIVTNSKDTLFVKQKLLRPINCPLEIQAAQQAFLQAITKYAGNDKTLINTMTEAVLKKDFSLAFRIACHQGKLTLIVFAIENRLKLFDFDINGMTSQKKTGLDLLNEFNFETEEGKCKKAKCMQLLIDAGAKTEAQLALLSCPKIS